MSCTYELNPRIKLGANIYTKNKDGKMLGILKGGIKYCVPLLKEPADIEPYHAVAMFIYITATHSKISAWHKIQEVL